MILKKNCWSLKKFLRGINNERSGTTQIVKSITIFGINRINHAQKIIADGELQEATRDLQDGYEGASKRLSQVERKIDSLKSLKVLAEMVEENVRDAALAAVREGANSDGFLFDEYNEWEGKYK